MKEIWADSGLIVVSKNLDVLVSKIRKKLSRDERIKITNVHGVGYKPVSYTHLDVYKRQPLHC